MISIQTLNNEHNRAIELVNSVDDEWNDDATEQSPVAILRLIPSFLKSNIAIVERLDKLLALAKSKGEEDTE